MAERDNTSPSEISPTTSVSQWLMLSAPVEDRDALYRHAQLVCDGRPNARVVVPRRQEAGRARVYIVVDAGDVAGVVRGEETAVAALATVRAVVSRLFMFEPVLVPEPAGDETA